MYRSLSRRLGPLVLTFGTLAVLGQGCASVDGDAADEGAAVPLLDSGKSPVEFLDAPSRDSAAEADAQVTLNALCGSVNFCRGKNPDDPLACADYDGGPRRDGGSSGAGGAPTVVPDGGGAGGAEGSAGDASSSGTDGSLPTDAGASSDARAPRDAGDTALDGGSAEAEPPEAGAGSGMGGDAGVGSGGAGGIEGSSAGGSPGVPFPSFSDGAGPGTLPDVAVPRPIDEEGGGPQFACQVGGDDYGNAVHRCGRSGMGGRGAPCAVSSDCRAGLACVGAVGAGQCLPYCCHPGTVCSDVGDGGRQTFCGERPLLEGIRRTTPLQVPVCVPAEECRLLDDPYPCTGNGCACGPEMACAVVRDDGTTACVTPGTGKSGEECPCAAGHYCSQGTNLCSRLCKTAAATDDCAPGRCAAAGGLPEGFGLCVGAASR